MTRKKLQIGTDRDDSLDSLAKRFDEGYIPEDWERYKRTNSFPNSIYAAMRSPECAAYQGHRKQKRKIWTVPLKALASGALALAGRKLGLDYIETNHVAESILFGMFMGIPAASLLGNAIYNSFTSRRTEMENSIEKNRRNYLSRLPF